MPDYLKTRIVQQVQDIGFAAGKKIVDTNNKMAFD